MDEIDLYEGYICSKCGRCSELCNCVDEEETCSCDEEIDR